ncbi:MAG: FixH family protein [Gammaproteobacteria bacterium]|nr:FixH family protein [Gammaproteobacteria bacterium]
MRQEDTQPWYKQFWPWFLISIPLASIIGGISMIVISIDGADTLVKEDYYKEGLAINKQFDKIEQAKKMGIQATLSLQVNKLSLQLQSKEVISDNLSLLFSHATIESKDFELKLQQTATGNYFALLDQQQVEAINGKWYLQLHPYSGSWQLKGQWQLPSDRKLVLGL